jgi:hypothetical protein
LFRQTAEGQLLKGLGLYFPTDPQRPIVVTFQPYDKEKKALGDPMWMPRSEWQALEFTEMTTSREAWDKALGWLLLMYLCGVTLAGVVILLVSNMLQSQSLQINWTGTVKLCVLAFCVLVVSTYRWLLKIRRWQVDLG